jgi:flavodoxin I
MFQYWDSHRIQHKLGNHDKSLEDNLMKALVLYESFFGNTEKIARAVGTALGLADSDIVRVIEFKPAQLVGVDLLIVGTPTRAFQPSQDTKAFLKRLPSNSLAGKKVAAFDTRAVFTDKTPGILKFMAGLFGYAAEPVSKKLVKKGGTQAQTPGWFYVLESEGPLKNGELEHAAEWAKGIK